LPINSTGAATFEQAKADYLVWLFTRNIAEGLIGSIWYTMDGPGWKSSGLLDPNQDPLPAFQALKFAAKELVGKTYVAHYISFPGVEGFQFSNASGKVWVLFSQDNATYTIPVPTGFSAAYDVLGNPISPTGGVLTVDHPIYVELIA
jgi:hypothetical protein